MTDEKDNVPDYVQRVLKTVAQKTNINDYKVKVNEGNKKGEGFLGQLMFIEISDNESEKVVNVVVKKAFSDEKIRELAPIRISFLNEVYFYEHILPTFQKLEEEYKIKVRFDRVPKCFMSCTEEAQELLVLENLKSLGYDVFDKKKVFTREHVNLIFKTYGHYHALSFALKKKYPEKFMEISSNCEDVFNQFSTRPHFKQSIQEAIGKIAELFVPGKEDKYIESFKKYVEGGADIFLESVNYRGDNTVIFHGDCWSNNMMFKYDDGNALSDIKVIDWQLVRAGAPSHDLTYCLYSGATKEIFDHLDDLLNIYHQSLSAKLAEFGESSDELYPMEALKKDWQHSAKFSMIFSFLICRMKLTVQEDIIDLTDDIDLTEDNRFFKTRVADSYNQRMKDLVAHIYEIGAL